MGEMQTLVTVVMALIIGFVLGRASRSASRASQHELTQEEQARLNPKQHRYGENLKDHSQQLAQAIRKGQKLQAIKRYREQHNTDLKEAKEAVEMLIELNR